MLSLSNLIDGSVDYAGLFPPAGLPMEDVVANYHQYLSSPERAMLGRLIIPALKLTSFEAAASEIPSAHPSGIGPSKSTWQISALVPPVDPENGSNGFQDFDAAFDAILAFNQRCANASGFKAVVDAVEIKTTSIPSTVAIIKRLPESISAFLEVSWQSDPEPLIQSIADQHGRKSVFAKIRTGGVTPELIPSSQQIARFIETCAKCNIGFKATAGLHHPIRAQHRLTYQDDAPVAIMHGFLNVFVATVIAFEHQVSQDILTDILNCTDAEKFGFTDQQLRWESLSVSAERIEQLRATGIVSFGSCSFTEPTEELVQLSDAAFASVFSV